MTDAKHLSHFPSVAEISYQLLAMICVNTQTQWTAVPSFLFTDMALWSSTKPACLTDFVWQFIPNGFIFYANIFNLSKEASGRVRVVHIKVYLGSFNGGSFSR